MLGLHMSKNKYENGDEFQLLNLYFLCETITWKPWFKCQVYTIGRAPNNIAYFSLQTIFFCPT